MITGAPDGFVTSEVHNGITTIEFFHPQANSLTSALLYKLAQAVYSAGNDEDCRVIVLKSGGYGAFCSGASFNEMAEIQTEEVAFKFFSGVAQVINAMRLCGKLIIARIHGKCVGGGVGIAGAADYAIAVEGADVKLSELSLGIGPFVIAPALMRKMGPTVFGQLAIDAQMWRNADWARRKGIYAELHPDTSGMDENINRLAHHLSQSGLAATSALKATLWSGTEHWTELLADNARTSARLLLQPKTQELIATKLQQKHK